MGDVNEALLKSILRKVHNSEPLNNEERHYREKLFSDMMGSKKIVQKTVRILTGEELRKERNSELRKSKTDEKPTRKDPRYTEGKNPAKIEGDNTNPQILQAKAKILDADMKPKEVKTEAERLGDKTQNPIMPRSEAVKFVSLNPVKAGDIVIKNFASSGQMLIKGVVLNIDEVHGTATVKWAHGRTSHEFAHTLVKDKKKDEGEDPKLGVPKAEEEAKNPPMTKQVQPRKKPSVGTRIRTAAQGVARTAQSKYRRARAGRMRGQIMRQPGRHAQRAAGQAAQAISPSPFKTPQQRAAHVREAASATARAIGSRGPAREARQMSRDAKTQFGMFGNPKTKRPYGVKQKYGKTMKADMTPKELERSKRLAERMKGKKGIDNPHALARHLVQQKFTKVERIEIVNSIIQSSLIEKHRTPKQHPHGKRRGAVGEAVRGGALGALVGTRRGRSIIDRARRVASRLPAAARRTARRVGRAARRTARKLPRIAGRVARRLPGAARALAGRHPVGAAALAGAALAVASRRRKKVRKQAVGEKVRQTARRLGSAAGRAVGSAAERAGGAVESTYRRGRAARMRRQVIRQPGRHVGQAIREAMKPRARGALGRVGTEAARAIGSIGPARRARRMQREAKTQYGLFGAKVKKPYGVKQKVQKDGDIVSSRENITTPVGSNMPTPTPFEDLTNVLQQTINLAAEVKTKQNRTADQEVKEYYAGILIELRGISEKLLASLSMELNEAQSSEDND